MAIASPFNRLKPGIEYLVKEPDKGAQPFIQRVPKELEELETKRNLAES